MEGGLAAPSALHGHKLQRRTGIALPAESFSFEDGQPVQLEDGSMAYIHHTPKGGPVGIMAGGEGRGLGEHKHPLPRDKTLLTWRTALHSFPGQTMGVGQGVSTISVGTVGAGVFSHQGKDTHSSLTVGVVTVGAPNY